MVATNPIQGFDLPHQLSRLRFAKSMSDGEAELIFRTISENLHSYDQVTEVSPCRASCLSHAHRELTIADASSLLGCHHTYMACNLLASAFSTSMRPCGS